jgi:uncharacterized protein
MSVVGFDELTVTLLVLRADAPRLDEAAATALQNAHLSFRAAQHEARALLAGGPLPDERIRGLSVWGVEPERAAAIGREDPAVQAGRLAVLVLPWRVPAGTISFALARVPRSVDEAAGLARDSYSVTLLTLRADAPALGEEAAGALQDAHMAHNSALHDAGHLLAAGPLTDDLYRGLDIWSVEAEEAAALESADPVVVRGRLAPRTLPWSVPAGAMTFSASHFPSSRAEVASG